MRAFGAFVAEAARVPGVQSVGSIRVRQAGAEVFAGLTVDVARSAGLEEAHRIASDVDERISRLVPRGDVIVHVDPVRRSSENLSQTVSALAAGLGLSTHDVHAHEVRDRHYVDMHVEVPADLTLGEAHALVSRLEATVKQELPQVANLHSHIEPYSLPAEPVRPLATADEIVLRDQIAAIVRATADVCGCHQIYIRPGPHGLDVVLHCALDAALSVAEAHRVADALEKRIRIEIPRLSEVLIHVEPAGDGESD